MIQIIAELLKKYGSLFLYGTEVTLLISTFGTLLGFVLGFITGLIRSIPITKGDYSIKAIIYRLLIKISDLYLIVFRGTPMIVQAMVIYYGSLQALNINIDPFTAGIIVITLNTGAYMAETVRGGIQSVEPGQMEGAKALGMSHFTTMLNVVLPQAFRNIVPQMGNTFISNIKDTSVLNIISVSELFFATKSVSGTTYKYFESYIITAAIYLVLTIFFNFLFKVLEKRLNSEKSYEMA